MSDLVITLRLEGMGELIAAVTRLASIQAVLAQQICNDAHHRSDRNPHVADALQSEGEPCVRRADEEGAVAPVRASSDQVPTVQSEYQPREPAGQPAIVASPAADESSAPAKRGTVFTPERLALLKRQYTAGVALPTLHAAINALPGAAIAQSRLAVEAAKRGWRRPKPVETASKPVTTALDAVYADHATIAKWAGERGLVSDGKFDLAAVNAKRNTFGLPPYTTRLR